MFIASLKTIKGSITRESVYAAMAGLKFEDPALLAPIDFSKLPGPSKDAPRVPSGVYNVYEFKGAKLSLTQAMVDVYQAP